MDAARSRTDPGQASLTPYLPRLLIGWQCDSPELAVRPLAGTLLFADVSGFTTMSERLARRGKVGAEEVTDVLNGTFARLLSVAYENGGGLLKFGGDALLIFFRGPEHEARACHAAVGMRAKLREIGRITTSAGQVRLRMSIGVNSGIFNFFLAGRSHRELIVTGPSASVTVEMEHAASAGEILVAPQTASALDASLLGERRDGGRLLRKAPPAPMLTGFEAAPDAGGVDLAAFLPSAIRAYVGTPAAEGEHRRVVVAFMRFSGTDALLAERHPLDVAAMFDELVSVAQQATDEHGITFLGSDIDGDGGKIILLAGAPQSNDNDEERMLRAVRQIADAGIALPLQIGVNRGHAYVGDVGPPYRRTYTVIGDVVNLAARVMAKAEPGEILVTEDVLSRSRTLFDATPLDPFMVKGKSQPVVASRLGAVRGVRQEDAGEALPLIGRDEEVERIRKDLAAAAAGSARVVEITGEPGIGKSRLVDEIRALAAPMRVLVITAEQYEAGTPYFSFRQLIRTVAGIDLDASAGDAGTRLSAFVRERAPSLAPWLPFLAIAAGAHVPATPESDAIAPEFRRARLRSAVGSFVSAALDDPAVLIFEDAHWMDEASADLLHDLVRTRPDDAPWLVCVARREHEGGFAFAAETERTVIALDRLSADASMSLAATASHDALLPQQIALVAERSGGHPLFLRELVAATEGAGDTEALPENVEAVITARIDRLDPEDRTLLRHAAVLGAHFTLDLLRDITGEPIGERAMRGLGEFVERRGPNAFRFRQALYRDVAYEELPFRRRRKLHRAAGEIIEARSAGAEDAAELLSLHFHHAQAHERSWRYSRLAGDQAKDKFANVQAASFYRRALEASRHVAGVSTDGLAEVWESLGDVLELAAEFGDAAESYRTARRLSPPERFPGLMLKEGMIRERLGQYSQALSWFTRARRASEKLPPPDAEPLDRVRADIAVAVARHRQGRLHACIQVGTRALAEAEEIGAVPELARASFVIGAAHIANGSPGAEPFAERAVRLYAKTGDLLGEANAVEGLGILRYWEGRWAESLAHYRRGGKLRERAGHVIYAALSQVNAAEILSDQGHLDEARQLFEEALSVWRAAHYPLGISVATSNLARVAARDGRHDEAREMYAQALDGFRSIGAEVPVLETEARMAELNVFRGDHHAALDGATDTLDRAAELGGIAAMRAMLHRIQGWALLQAGDPVLAQDALDESLHLARKARAPFEVAQTLQAWAALARRTDRASSAVKRERKAVEILEQLGVVSTPVVPLPRI